jgi:GH43 family beta-xylosidase
MEFRSLRHLIFVLIAGLGLLSLAGSADAAKPPKQLSLRNPILPLDATNDDSPDPWIFRHNGRYWINYTSSGKLIYRKATRLAGLADAPEVQIWPPEGQTEPDERSADLWAAETHRIDGRWFVYYSANSHSEGVTRHRMYVLESQTRSPAGPYEFKGQLNVPDPYAIDGTLIQLRGKLYVAYSGGPNFTPAAIRLVRLSNPWTVKGLPITISNPEYAWEKEGFPINEGPEVLIHGKQLHMIYSASWCGSGLYALGRLTVPKSSDLMNPATWANAKYPDPVFQTAAARGVYGPGHGSFFTTDGGRHFWNVYHATEQPGKGCFTGGLRTTRVQPFTWNYDGTPNFRRPVSVDQDVRAPTQDATIAIQAESSKFNDPARATRLDERRFFGYAGMTLEPAEGKLTAMRFRLNRPGPYRLFLRVLAGPESGVLTLVRPDGREVSRDTTREKTGPVELNMGRMKLNRGRRFLRLRSTVPVKLDQIRLQPQRK